MEPFKERINDNVVKQLGIHLKILVADEVNSRFIQKTLIGLNELELKERVEHVAKGLVDAFNKVPLSKIDGWIGQCVQDKTSGKNEQGLSGWIIWPLSLALVRTALSHQDAQRCVQWLAQVTSAFTSEFAIRESLADSAIGEEVFELLLQERFNACEHRRRLACEGLRPRLPWGLKVKGLGANPKKVEALLELLQDDTSAYVRTSCANHLADLSKEHPEWFCAWVKKYQKDASKERLWVLRHASRYLLKHNDAPVLSVWGLNPIKVQLEEIKILKDGKAVTDQKNVYAVSFEQKVVLEIQARLVFDPKALKNKGSAVGAIQWDVHVMAPSEKSSKKRKKVFKGTVTKDGQTRVSIKLKLQNSSVFTYCMGKYEALVYANGVLVHTVYFDLQKAK